MPKILQKNLAANVVAAEWPLILALLLPLPHLAHPHLPLQAHHQPHQALAVLAAFLPLLQLQALLPLPHHRMILMSLRVFPLLSLALLAALVLWLLPQHQLQCYQAAFDFPLPK